jgi:hypothetical protein
VLSSTGCFAFEVTSKDSSRLFSSRIAANCPPNRLFSWCCDNNRAETTTTITAIAIKVLPLLIMTPQKLTLKAQARELLWRRIARLANAVTSMDLFEFKRGHPPRRATGP